MVELVSHEEVKQCFTPQLKGSTPAQCIHMISSQFLYFALSELLIVFFSGNFGIYLSVIGLIRDKRLGWLQASRYILMPLISDMAIRFATGIVVTESRRISRAFRAVCTDFQ